MMKHLVVVDAMELAERGKRITRAQWDNEGRKPFYIHVEAGAILDDEGNKYPLSLEDILADDWMMY